MSQQINLFNPVFRQQKKYLSAATMAQALGMILAGSLLLSGYLAYRASQLKGQAAMVTAQLNDARKDMDRVNIEFPPRQKNTALALDIQKTETDLQALQKISDILQKGELGNTNGYADYFRAFARQIVDGVWLTDISILGAGAEIGLHGRTLDPELVPTYISRLKNEPVMQGKSFAQLKMQAPQPAAAKAEAAGKQPGPVNYIEFSLQSSGLAKADVAPGARDK